MCWTDYLLNLVPLQNTIHPILKPLVRVLFTPVCNGTAMPTPSLSELLFYLFAVLSTDSLKHLQCVPYSFARLIIIYSTQDNNRQYTTVLYQPPVKSHYKTLPLTLTQFHLTVLILTSVMFCLASLTLYFAAWWQSLFILHWEAVKSHCIVHGFRLLERCI